MFKLREEYRGVKKGSVYGTRTVIGVPFEIRQLPSGDSKQSPRIYVHCVIECKCGKVCVIGAKHLLASSKCLFCSNPNKRHGERHTKLWSTWQNMRQRCFNSKTHNYQFYGGRGISVCREWTESFVAFSEWSKLNGYAAGLEIDRIDTNGNYEPSNCRWITKKMNGLNKRSNVVFEAFGERKSCAEWRDDPRCTVKYATLLYRLHSGMNPEKAITQCV